MCAPLAARGNGTWCPEPVPCQRESAGRREMGTERTSPTPRRNSEPTLLHENDTERGNKV